MLAICDGGRGSLISAVPIIPPRFFYSFSGSYVYFQTGKFITTELMFLVLVMSMLHVLLYY